MDASERAALWIIATGVVVAGLYFLREPVTQFVLAVILWLTIDGVASAIRRASSALVPTGTVLLTTMILGERRASATWRPTAQTPERSAPP